MTTELVKQDTTTEPTRLPTYEMDLSAIERLIVLGDLSKLSGDERWSYYVLVCRSVGLNPATQPFQYITLNSKLVLYATKGAAEQLRDNNHVSIDITSRERIDDLYVVTARATTPDGRHDEEIGAVPIGSLKGDALANALMKATTKAKRRVTLSMIGLGMLDETEVETIPNVRYETNSDVHGEHGGDERLKPPYICVACNAEYGPEQECEVRKSAKGPSTMVSGAELAPVSLQRFGVIYCARHYDLNRWPPVVEAS